LRVSTDATFAKRTPLYVVPPTSQSYRISPGANANRSNATGEVIRAPASLALMGRLGTAFAVLKATGHWLTNMPTTSAAIMPT
jgi:hypothetical protein